MTDNETLTSAASKLRTLATAAHGEDWSVATASDTHPEGDGATHTIGVQDDADETLVMGDPMEGEVCDEDAQYIATMDPRLGGLLAEWLEDAASGDDEGIVNPYALAVAQQIIGATEETA